nr:PREDICTED: keratin-associated protein 5-5-like isoform X2 [Bemisia tabaci]XP_018915555.1 PREDICTED: keratin-associated protein 5-5-like isoform X2 [Bemisia tabaci]XP_018915556.1 PREDICTED: keratin-associated protein 5-5-like isoform X2 [Bemisia tabaci]
MSGNKCCCDIQEQKCCEVNCRCALCRVYHRYTQCGRPSLNVMCCRGRWWKSPMKPKSKSITACVVDPNQNRDNCNQGRDTCCTGRMGGGGGACCPANLGCKPSPPNAGCCPPPDCDPCNPCPKTCPAPCPVPCPPKMCCSRQNCCMKTITTSECGCKLPCCCPKPRPCAKSVSCCQLECQQKLCKCTYTPTFKCCPQNFPLSCCPKNSCCQTCTKDLPVCCTGNNSNNGCNNDCNSCCRYGSNYNPAQQPMSTYTGAPFDCTVGKLSNSERVTAGISICPSGRNALA